MAVDHRRPAQAPRGPALHHRQGTYLDDIQMSGMTYMAILRSPYAHAKIGSIDTSAAAAMPGVVAVFTGADLRTTRCPWPGRPVARRGARTTSTRRAPWRPTTSSGPARAWRRSWPRRRSRRRTRSTTSTSTGSRCRPSSTPRPRPRTARPSSTRTRPTTSSSTGRSATWTAPTPRWPPPTRSSGSASSTSVSSRTRSRRGATSAGTTRVRTSTRSGCRARRRISSDCSSPPS